MTHHPSTATTGRALFSLGFRPFFLLAGLWAVCAIVLWLMMLTGWRGVALPSAFDPVSWHAHEILFGYLGAVLAGFLLTAVPNWTGRAPMRGRRLVVLVVLWGLGRLAVALSALLPAGVVAGLDLAFPLACALILAIELFAARNWRNLPVLLLLVAFAGANGLFHWQAAQGGFAAGDTGLRAGLSVAVLLVALIGGRVTPAFTRNWMKARGMVPLPAAPGRPFDQAALLILALALAAWVGWPETGATAAALLLAGGLHLLRLARWRGRATRAEPLLWILHVGYGFVPLGAAAVGLSVLAPGQFAPAAALHVWTGGVVAVMPLAVMTRAVLGHTGRPLRASRGTVVMFGAVILSILLRVVSAWAGAGAMHLYQASALCWVVGFGLFLGLYGPMMLRPRVDAPAPPPATPRPA